MSYVIAEPCVAACNAECAKVCPMDCIHGPVPLDELELVPRDERAVRLARVQLYIDPAVCIDCGACTGECPTNAIFPDDELPERWRHYAELNARFFAP